MTGIRFPLPRPLPAFEALPGSSKAKTPAPAQRVEVINAKNRGGSWQVATRVREAFALSNENDGDVKCVN